eukprot:6210679-Prymnesium_polylepis.1
MTCTSPASGCVPFSPSRRRMGETQMTGFAQVCHRLHPQIPSFSSLRYSEVHVTIGVGTRSFLSLMD